MQKNTEIQDSRIYVGKLQNNDSNLLPELLKAHKETSKNQYAKRNEIEIIIDGLYLPIGLRNKAVKAISQYYTLKTVITD